MGQKSSETYVIPVTPVISTGIYASGDQIGGLQTVVSAARTQEEGSGILHSIVVVDIDKEKAPLDILFFNTSVTVASSDNAALDITDAQVKASCLGSVSIAATDYVDIAGSSIATVRNIGLDIRLASGSTSLYAIAVVRGTPTYTTTSDLVFKYGFLPD